MIYSFNLKEIYRFLDYTLTEVTNDSSMEDLIAEWIFWSMVGEIINQCDIPSEDKIECFADIVHLFGAYHIKTDIYKSLINKGRESEYYRKYSKMQTTYRFSDIEEELGTYWRELISEIKPYRLIRAVRWLDVFLSDDVINAIDIEIYKYENGQLNVEYIERLRRCSDMLKEKIGVLTEMRELPFR